jgi:hypothetical protein
MRAHNLYKVACAIELFNQSASESEFEISGLGAVGADVLTEGEIRGAPGRERVSLLWRFRGDEVVGIETL